MWEVFFLLKLLIHLVELPRVSMGGSSNGSLLFLKGRTIVGKNL